MLIEWSFVNGEMNRVGHISNLHITVVQRTNKIVIRQLLKIYWKLSSSVVDEFKAKWDRWSRERFFVAKAWD